MLLLALILIFLYYSGIEFGIFFTIVCVSIFVIRRKIIQLNSTKGRNKKIIFKGKLLIVPQNTEIFEVKNSTSFELLKKYAETMQLILVPPSVLIIRFNQQLTIDKSSAKKICELLKLLSDVKIRTVFSDIEIAQYNQLEFYGILDKIGEKDIYPNIEVTLKDY